MTAVSVCRLLCAFGKRCCKISPALPTLPVMSARVPSSALSSVWNTSRCTAWLSRKRISVLVGCTFTSTISGGISKNKANAGVILWCSTSRYACFTACSTTLSRTKRRLTKQNCNSDLPLANVGLETKPCTHTAPSPLSTGRLADWNSAPITAAMRSSRLCTG